MTVLKLVKSTLNGLPAVDRVTFYYDEELTGFGLRVSPSGARSWICEYRAHGGGRAAQKRRMTLGSTSSLTPDQARAEARRILAQVRLGGDPASEKVAQRETLTVSALVDAFIAEHIDAKLKASTSELHRAALERLRDAHGSLKADATALHGHMARLHSKWRATPYSANRAIAVWSKLYAWSAARKLTPAGFNPAKGIERYREQGRERYLTREELGRLGDALREAETDGIPWEMDESLPQSKHLAKPENRRTKLDPYAVAAIRLLVLTGARLREILHLRWDQIDWERGVAFLADSKTGRKPLFLSAPAQAIMSALPRLDDNPHVIAGAKEGAARADLHRPWATVSKRAQLEGVRIHDLRHSFASVGAGASLGLPIIGKLLGHTQASTTQRYAHLDVDPLKRAADTIGSSIAAAMDRQNASIVELPNRKTAR